jgi:RimJ/RimL family protein N-acetyltransferase
VWLEFVGDPEAVSLTHRPEPVRDRQFAVDSLRQWIDAAEGEIGMYSVRLRDTHETIGFVGFVPREMPWGSELELGWLLRPRFWGNGYATEAAQALRSLARGRVISLIRIGNEASANVARKLGMTIERKVDYRGFATEVWVSAGPRA